MPAIAPVDLSVTTFVGPLAGAPRPVVLPLRGMAQAARLIGAPPDGVTGAALRLFFHNGGTQARLVTTPDGSPEALADGLRTVEREVPETGLLNLPGVDDPATLEAAAALCGTLGALLILDPPRRAATDPGLLAEALPALPASPHAALWWPWVQDADPADPAGGTVPPGGAIAGLIARADGTRGAWKQPGGRDAPLRGLRGPAAPVSAARAEDLSTLSVNTIRVFPGTGLLSWGARTLAADADGLRHVAPRRLTALLRRSLDAGLAWTRDAPVTEALRLRVLREAGDFLHDLHRQGAFAGALPRDAWSLRWMDGPDTGQPDGRAPRPRLQVRVALLRPGEFVMLPFTL